MSRMREAIKASVLDRGGIAEGGEIVRYFRFGSDFPGFAGHFPAYPVLPAVVQVLTARVVSEESVGDRRQMLSLERGKFLRQLRPDEEIEVRCRERKGGDEPLWEGRLSVAGETAASFWMRFGPTEEPS